MKILVTTSSLPVSANDKVPAFVKDQVIALKKLSADSEFIIHAPHNAYSQTAINLKSSKEYVEVRYHYFWPRRWELLAGRGIMPALKQNRFLYLEIPFFVFFQFVSLFRLARNEKPDLIYAHWFTPQAITSALVSKLTHTPFVFTTHAHDVQVLSKLPFAPSLVRAVCSRASAFTAVSVQTAKKLEQMFESSDWKNKFAKKLSIIPMGVNIDPGRVEQTILNKTRKKYGIPENRRYVLFIGRLAEKKGVKYLIEAAASLRPELLSKLHFIVAGDGQLRKSLENQAQQLDLKSITFTGYVHGTDKDTLMQMADILCLPSIVDSKGDSEGLPVAFMEGLAGGKIVLASDVSGAESFIEDGVSGYIFKQKSVKSLASAMAASLDNSKKKKIETASKKLASQFDWDKVAEAHYQIFKQVLG